MREGGREGGRRDEYENLHFFLRAPIFPPSLPPSLLDDICRLLNHKRHPPSSQHARNGRQSRAQDNEWVPCSKQGGREGMVG